MSQKKSMVMICRSAKITRVVKKRDLDMRKWRRCGEYITAVVHEYHITGGGTNDLFIVVQ